MELGLIKVRTGADKLG